MKALYITNMYPNKLNPYYGIFVKQEVQYLSRNGIDVEVVFINGKKSKFEYIKSPFVIFKELSRKKFDIINVQHSLLLSQTLLARKLLRLRTPVVFTFHEGEMSSESAAGNIVETFLASARWKTAFMRYVDLVITRNSEVMGNCGNVPVVEIPSPVNIEIFGPLDKAQCRSKLGIEMNKPVIFFAADPAKPGKNFAFLKEVIEELNHDREQKLQVLTGPILPEKMPLYYNACNVVCLPSLYEASPLVIREAMACNRPVVASDVGDIRKTVANVDGCFVISDWSKSTFCECILAGLEYGNTKGRERILEMGWDWETTVKKVISTFRQLV